MNHYIEASFENLLKDATSNASQMLQQGKDEVDALFGVGFAANHPELVAAYMQAASADLNATTQAKVYGAALLEIAASLQR